MPTYDYRCEACEHVFEEFQNMTDDPLEECPKCKGSVKRLIGGGAGIIFKGSGFYATDYNNAKCKDVCGKGTPCSSRDKPCNTKED